jgi:hypothetical protein
MTKKATQEQESPQASLDELFQKGASVEDGKLAGVLKGKITLAEGTDRVFITTEFAKESAQKRLVAVGLGRHVLRRKDAIKEEELAKPSEWYSLQVQVKPKSVLEELSRLKGRGIFERNDQGYYIPLWALKAALDFIQK